MIEAIWIPPCPAKNHSVKEPPGLPSASMIVPSREVCNRSGSMAEVMTIKTKLIETDTKIAMSSRRIWPRTFSA